MVGGGGGVGGRERGGEVLENKKGRGRGEGGKEDEESKSTATKCTICGGNSSG